MGGKYDTSDAGKDGNMIYDDAAFQLFFVAILASAWIPMFLYRSFRIFRRLTHVPTPLEKAKEEWCACSLCQAKADRLDRKTGARAFGLSNIIFVVMTVLLAFMSIRVYRANLTAESPFDPFAILGVTENSTPREIKKAYRRLSVVHHPDKNRDDPSAGERFIKITKAFAALTDEASKENYFKYGNPDGYMGTTLGLGLPEWVAKRSSSVLVAYFIFLVLFFPLGVGLWWRQRSQELTSEILSATFVLYRETLQQTRRFRDLLAAFCGSFEFAGLYQSDNDDHVRTLMESLKRAGKTDIKKTKSFVETSPVQVQNLFVVTAYLARLPIPEELEYVLTAMLLRTDSLLTAMTDTVGAFQRPDCQKAWDKSLMRGHTGYLATCVNLSQCLIQQLDEKMSPFLQIPHFTEREVKFCTSSRTPVIKTIYDFMRLEMSEQRNVLRGFNDDQFLDVKAFLDRYPSARLEVGDALVEGEEDTTVHAGDRVTVRAKLTIMRRSGSVFSPHTPNLPFRKEEVWWIWLADHRLQCPIDVKRLMPKMARGHDPHRRKKPHDDCCGVGDALEHEDSEEERLTADPRVTIFDVKFNFLAPRAGVYNLEVRTACDCYNGASKAQILKMKVEKEVEPPPEDSVRYFDTDDESSEEESSSEEEEDEEEDTDGEYEYIEVTDDESEEEGDFDDEFGVSDGPRGDPSS